MGRILTVQEFQQDRPRNQRIVCTSGGYDPAHSGHITCIQKSKEYGDLLVVLVNGDGFLRRKKGKEFLPVEERAFIISALAGVDVVLPLTDEYDQDTVIEALRAVKPHVFTKGGDRCDERTIPEWDVCQELGIRIVTGVGNPKTCSSSNFLEDWGRFYTSRAGHRVP
jgi:cytidyltransferase-like protein